MTPFIPLPVLYMGAVFVLIAVRRIGSLRIPIWLIMLAGAIASLASLQITPGEALRAIDLDVMLFLLGMFVVGRALQESGLLPPETSSSWGRRAT